MLPGNILTLPLVALFLFSNESQSRTGESEEAPPRAPSPLQPPGRWSTASWGECSNPCGSGEEQRLVSCVLEDVTATLIVVVDGFCAPPKPASSRQCYQTRDECANAWVSGDWGQCSAKCGGGQRTRLVECHARRGDATSGPASGPASSPPPPVAVPLSDAQCVPQLRPDDRRECNLQPCPDGRRVRLRTSDGRKPRRIRLFSKFTLRCPFPVFWTPADDRSKRKYAWFKDGRRLPLHEDKFTQTDSRGELRVKGADEADSGVYTCASLTSNPQGRAHNMTVTLERVPGEPTPTQPPPPLEEAEEDSTESAPSSEQDAEGRTTPAAPAPTEARSPTSSLPPAKPDTTGEPLTFAAPAPDATTAAPAVSVAAAALIRRAKRELLDDSDTSSPSGAIVVVVAARYDATPFSNCSMKCGAEGLRQRAVRCVDNETGAHLPLADCEDLGPPPPPQEFCNREDCPPTWQWPSWASIKCSRRCGGGAKWRQARCTQTLANGTQVALGANRCVHLGAGEERRDCHREACRALVNEGAVLRLDCMAANATWRRESGKGSETVDLADANKYFANNDTGTLYVYDTAPGDAGQYLCDESEGHLDSEGKSASDAVGAGASPRQRAVRTHRFEVTVFPVATTLTRRRADHDDDLFVRVAKCKSSTSTAATPEIGEAVLATASPTAAGGEGSSRPAPVGGGEASTVTAEPEATEEPIPWHVLLTRVAPTRGGALGIFS